MRAELRGEDVGSVVGAHVARLHEARETAARNAQLGPQHLGQAQARKASAVDLDPAVLAAVGQVATAKATLPRRAPLRLSRPTSSAHRSAVAGSLPVNRPSSSRSMPPGRMRLITALFHTFPHVAHR